MTTIITILVVIKNRYSIGYNRRQLLSPDGVHAEQLKQNN